MQPIFWAEPTWLASATVPTRASLSRRCAMRRRRLLLGTVVMLAAGLLAAWLDYAGAGITLENYERIQTGMTLEDVQAVLGGPPRDDRIGGCGPLDSELSVGRYYDEWEPMKFRLG